MEEAWNVMDYPSVSEGKTWDMLNKEEQLHATELCLFEDNWDGFDMMLLVNLTPHSLANTRMGVGRRGLLTMLRRGGWAPPPPPPPSTSRASSVSQGSRSSGRL